MGGWGVHCIEAALWAAKLKVKGQNTYSQASRYLVMVVLSKLSPSMVKLTKLGKLIVKFYEWLGSNKVIVKNVFEDLAL